MSADRTTPPQRVPILTEVVLLPEAGGVDIQIDPPPPPVTPLAAAPLHAAPAANSPLAESSEGRAEAQRVEDQRVDEQHIEEQLVEDVWTDLQRQVDLMLEYRVRETLAPILTRATEAVVRESRQQLASTLRDMVARAVAQELARHRGR